MTGILLSTGKEINKFLSPRTDKDCHTEFLGLVLFLLSISSLFEAKWVLLDLKLLTPPEWLSVRYRYVIRTLSKNPDKKNGGICGWT